MAYETLLTGVNSCDVSDACDSLGIRAARSGAILPVYPDCDPVVGRLLTLTLVPGAGASLAELADAFIRAAELRAEVALVDLGGRTDVQCWGSMLAIAARLRGIHAAVVNGAVRDVDGLQELSFPTYARGVYPGAMRQRLAFAGTGRDAVIDGVAVTTGWLVVADANGVVSFPAERAEEVLATATAMARAERDLVARIRAAGTAARSLELLRERR